MGLLNFLSNSHQEKGKEYLKQLFLVAYADGSLDDIEKSYILSVGTRFNIPPEEVEKLSQDLKPDDIKYKLPGNAEERFFLLFCLINLIRANGEIHPHEIKVTENIVMRLGYAPDTVGIILQTIEHNQDRNISVEDTYQHLKELLG